MSSPAAPARTDLTRPPLMVAVASFVSSFDRFAVAPVLVLIGVGMGAPLAAVVTAASGYYLAYGLSQPLWGMLSDRYGRIRVMRGTLIGAAVTGAASALAPDLGLLIAARILTGAFFGAIIPTSLTYLGDTVAAANRQRALTDLMAATAFGTALATAFGGGIGHLAGWRAVFAVPAVCAVFCSFALRGIPEPARELATGGVRAQLASVLRRPWAWLVFGLGFAEGAVLLGTMTFLASALEHHGVSPAWAGLATAAYGLGIALLTRAVKVLSRRVPVWWLITIGGVAMGAAYLIVSVYVSTPTVVITALLLGGGWAFMHSSIQTWATFVAPQARGTAVSFFAAALFIGSALAAAAFGPLADQNRYALIFATAAAITLPLTLIAALTRRRYG